jgi:hypothetical protein
VPETARWIWDIMKTINISGFLFDHRHNPFVRVDFHPIARFDYFDRVDVEIRHCRAVHQHRAKRRFRVDCIDQHGPGRVAFKRKRIKIAGPSGGTFRHREHQDRITHGFSLQAMAAFEHSSLVVHGTVAGDPFFGNQRFALYLPATTCLHLIVIVSGISLPPHSQFPVIAARTHCSASPKWISRSLRFAPL